MNLRQLRARSRLTMRRLRRYLVHNILHADDPPHRLALGVAIGLFVTFTPTLGIQMVLILLLAWLCRANLVIGLPVTWVSNPLTIWPIYYACYKVGTFVVGGDRVNRAWWEQLKDPPDGWISAISFYWERLMTVASPLWVGCLIVATLIGIASYIATYRLVVWYRMRRWGSLVPPTAEISEEDRERSLGASQNPRRRRGADQPSRAAPKPQRVQTRPRPHNPSMMVTGDPPPPSASEPRDAEP